MQTKTKKSKTESEQEKLFRNRYMPSTLKFLAIFMSLLIIFIPFNSMNVSAAVAEQVVIDSISGDDGILHIMRSTGDHVNIIASVNVVGTPDPSAVHVTFPGLSPAYETFNTCNDINYECSYKSIINDMPAGPGTYPIQICLGEAGYCSDDCSSCINPTYKHTSYIYVDNEAPSATSFDISPTDTNGEDLVATYIVKDTLCGPSGPCSAHCSGIKKIEIVDIDGNSFGEQDISSSLDDCTRSGTFDFDMTSADNGLVMVCLKMTDNLGHESENIDCLPINKDDTQPVITVNNIFDQTGTAPITYVKSGGTPVKYIINVTSSQYFDLDTVTADLTGFGAGELDLTCSKIVSGKFTCVKDFTLNLAGEKTADVTVEVVDLGGNTLTETDSITIKLDTIAPVLDNVISSSTYLNTGYLGPGLNNVIAIINETGAGLFGSNVQITIAGHGTNNAECVQISTQWYCKIENVTVTSDAEVQVQGADDAANIFGPSSVTLTYDDVKPEIINVTMESTTDNSFPFFKTGDSITTRAFIKESVAMTDDFGDYLAQAKFSFGINAFIDALEPDGCYNVTGGWICEWVVLNAIDGPINASFNLTDITGNNDDSSITDVYDGENIYVSFTDPVSKIRTDYIPGIDFEVYEVDTNTTPDYWENTVAGIFPSFIDSNTLQITGHDVWFQMQLTPKGDASLPTLAAASFDPATCKGDADNYLDTSNSFLISPQLGSETPWLKMAIPRGPIDKDPLSFQCELTLISLHNNKLSLPETENITLIVGVQPIKEISDELDDKIEDIKGGFLVETGAVVNQLAKLLTLFETFCNIITALNGLLGALGIINSVTAWTQNTFLAPLGASAESAAALGEGSTILGYAFLYKFCAFISCRISTCLQNSDSKVCGGFNTIYGNTAGKLTNQLPLRLDALSQGDLVGSALGGSGSKVRDNCGKKPEKSEPAYKDSSGDFDKNKYRKALDSYNICAKGERGLGTQSWSDVFWGDPKDSLLLSALFLCIPGLIKNFNKMTEVECQYLICVQQYMPQGVPILMCEKLRAYQWCMFIYGEIFNLIPFAKFIQNMIQQVLQMLANPTQLILGYVFKKVCAILVDWELTSICRLLQVYDAFKDMEDIYNQVKDNEDLIKLDDTTCKRALEFGDDDD